MSDVPPGPGQVAAAVAVAEQPVADDPLTDVNLAIIKGDLSAACRDGYAVTFTVTWRTQRRGRIIPPSEWTTWTGEAVEVDRDGVLWVSFPNTQDARPGVTAHPFPNPKLDYLKFDVTKVAPKTMPGGTKQGPRGDEAESSPAPKRARAENDPTTNPDQLASAFSGALLQVRTNKMTTAVTGGDGLRIPATIPEYWDACYPPIWWLRKQTTAANDLQEAWRTRWSNLRGNLGCIMKNPAKRDTWQAVVDTLALTIHAPAPSTRAQWSALFQLVHMALVEITTVVFSVTAAETLRDQLRAQLAEGLIDVESAYNAVARHAVNTPQTSTHSLAASTTTRTVTQQRQDDASEVLDEMRDLLQAFRGRGRARRGK